MKGGVRLYVHEGWWETDFTSRKNTFMTSGEKLYATEQFVHSGWRETLVRF